MRTDDFLSLNNISDPEFVRIAAIHGIDPSVDVLKASDQELILESLTEPSTQSTKSNSLATTDPSEALEQSQNATSEKLEAYLGQAEGIVRDLQEQCADVAEVVSEAIAYELESLMPSIAHRTTKRLAQVVPSTERISVLGKSESAIKQRLQLLRSPRSVAGALPEANGSNGKMISGS